MKAHRIAALTLAMAASLVSPASPADTPPDQAATAMQAHMQTMRERMLEIQRTQDPDKRKQLMDLQMKEMAAMMDDPNHNCPADGAKTGAMKGQTPDDAIARRMEMMRMMMPMMAPDAPAR